MCLPNKETWQSGWLQRSWKPSNVYSVPRVRISQFPPTIESCLRGWRAHLGKMMVANAAQEFESLTLCQQFTQNILTVNTIYDTIHVLNELRKFLGSVQHITFICTDGMYGSYWSLRTLKVTIEMLLSPSEWWPEFNKSSQQRSCYIFWMSTAF